MRIRGTRKLKEGVDGMYRSSKRKGGVCFLHGHDMNSRSDAKE